ncbi:MAG TPA: phospholipase D-like domain-containing protein, partial [Bdellovibrionales bacterium]|nr:phospholipase D-like domain-containing protein [Bdellovibrionales bacterium]
MEFQAGRNSWRVTQAGRVAFLVDAAAYFSAFAEAAKLARRSIFILGWDIHTHTRLAEGLELGPFLLGLLERNPELEIKILIWQTHLIYAFERQDQTFVKEYFSRHPRMKFFWDANHPPTASLHQKIVLIDGELAFSGGLDITQCRWDTPAHDCDEPGRVTPDGKPYGPFHDVQVMFDGPAARALRTLVAERWRTATGERLGFDGGLDAVWPESVRPELTEVPVAISRTLPRWNGQPGAFENLESYVDLIRGARRELYIESQYFSSERIVEAMKDRLREPAGPEVVVALPHRNSGWIEESTMGTLRYRVLKDLRAADLHGRLRVYYPVVKNTAGPEPVDVNLHSKVLIADGRFVRIGSANLSNRSMGLDAECDLTFEDRDGAGATGLRDRLISEHLGLTVEAWRAYLGRHGSLIAAIEARAKDAPGAPKALLQFPDELPAVLNTILPDTKVIDPPAPYRFTNWGKLVLDRSILPSRKQWAYILTIAAVIGAAALLWSFTPLRDWSDPRFLAAEMNRLGPEPVRSLAVLGIFILLSALLFPLNALLFAVSFIFDMKLTLLYCLVGSLASALLVFALGRSGSRVLPKFLEGEKSEKARLLLEQKGIYVVFLLRLLPLVPFSV